jgi:hypothetical protein
MENKYGEPWRIRKESIQDNQLNGVALRASLYPSSTPQLKRAVNCVNLLAGIPDEELPNVLKAYVEVKVMNAFEREEGEIVEHSDLIIARAHGNVTKYPELTLLDNLKNVSAK